MKQALHASRGARRGLGMHLSSRSCPDIAAAQVEIVFGGLATNAVVHAGTRLLVARGDTLRFGADR